MDPAQRRYPAPGHDGRRVPPPESSCSGAGGRGNDDFRRFRKVSSRCDRPPPTSSSGKVLCETGDKTTASRKGAPLRTAWTRRREGVRHPGTTVVVCHRRNPRVPAPAGEPMTTLAGLAKCPPQHQAAGRCFVRPATKPPHSAKARRFEPHGTGAEEVSGTRARRSSCATAGILVFRRRRARL